jgi:hypothetical protein
MTPELLWPVLSLIVLAGIAWGAIQYKTRDRRLDPLSERATKAVMDDPGPEPMKGDRAQQPGGVPSPSMGQPAPQGRSGPSGPETPR